MADDPLALFDAWFAEARAGEPNDPEAVALATADADGRPSLRIAAIRHDTEGVASEIDGVGHGFDALDGRLGTLRASAGDLVSRIAA